MTMASQVCDDHDELTQLFVYFCVPFVLVKSGGRDPALNTGMPGATPVPVTAVP